VSANSIVFFTLVVKKQQFLYNSGERSFLLIGLSSLEAEK